MLQLLTTAMSIQNPEQMEVWGYSQEVDVSLSVHIHGGLREASMKRWTQCLSRLLTSERHYFYASMPNFKRYTSFDYVKSDLRHLQRKCDFSA